MQFTQNQITLNPNFLVSKSQQHCRERNGSVRVCKQQFDFLQAQSRAPRLSMLPLVRSFKRK